MECLNKKKSANSGFSLIEMLIYVSLIAVILLFIINTVLGYTGSYRTLQAERIVENSGIDSMERMTRDIRAAKSINSGSTASALILIASSNGNSTTTEFYTYNNTLYVAINNATSGPLTLSSANVTSLVFTQLTSPNSSAVKIDLTISGTSGPVTTSKSFHSTIILRGQ